MIKELAKKYVKELRNNNSKYVLPSLALTMASLVTAAFWDTAPEAIKVVTRGIVIVMSFILFLYTGRNE